MSEAKHYNGLQQEIDKQASDNIKAGGPSDAFKREAMRNGIVKPHKDVPRKDGFVSLERGMILCIKCGQRRLSNHNDVCDECYED